jgi:hypothetical protein
MQTQPTIFRNHRCPAVLTRVFDGFELKDWCYSCGFEGNYSGPPPVLEIDRVKCSLKDGYVRTYGEAVCPVCLVKFDKHSWNQEFCTVAHYRSYRASR